MVVKPAISKKKIDTSAALLTRYPDGLADALQKIAADSAPMTHASTSTAHLWIDSPFKKQDIAWYQKLFMTHPPIAERIAALRAMGK
jgi:heat shock protein HtpX